MKTIDEVEKFILDFIKWEFKVSRSRFDSTISQKKHFKDASYFLDTFFSEQLIPSKRGGLDTKTRGKKSDIIQENYGSIRKRTLFLIRHYQNASFGEGVITDDKVLFSCITGADSIVDEIECYGKNFSVGVVRNDLKIISIRSIRSRMKIHDDGKLQWTYSLGSIEEVNGYTVLKEGKLLNTLRTESPEWQRDLNDFHSD